METGRRMKAAVVKETSPGERRVALVPEAIGKLQPAGIDVLVESGAGDGAWLSDAVWGMHGHYLDHHLLPVSAYGVSRDLLRRSARTAAWPIDYELSRRPSLARTARWLPIPMAALLDDAAELDHVVAVGRLRGRAFGHGRGRAGARAALAVLSLGSGHRGAAR